jgi:hypothetical protein
MAPNASRPGGGSPGAADCSADEVRYGNPFTQAKRLSPRPSFANWLQTDQPHRLGLSEFYVDQICRLMKSDRDACIVTWSDFKKWLKARHSYVHFESEREWDRVMALARHMWSEFEQSRRWRDYRGRS